MLAITCIAPVPGFPLTLGQHVFERAPDGQLLHSIDGDVRAIVPPEGWADYARTWPQCADLVGQLRRAPASSPATLPGVDSAAAALKVALAPPL